MQIENDGGLSDLLVAGSEVYCCGGFGFTEGGVWIAERGELLFSDIPGNTIHRWKPGDREAEPYRQPSGHANGNTLDEDGRLLTCEHSGRRVSIARIGGPAETLTDRFEGRRYNSPNDVVVHASGAVYFTDPTYGIEPPSALTQGDATAVREIDVQGVYRVAPDREVTRLLEHFVQPNGLVFSPDEAFLYIGDSRARIINRYAVRDDGTLADERLWVDQRGDERRGSPDGMRVDEDGRLWTTGAGGVSVIDADGTALGQFELEEHAANVCFGGPEFATLYLCTGTTIRSVETRVRGIAPGSR